jgi:plasmid maintenance system antidote protein VapI
MIVSELLDLCRGSMSKRQFAKTLGIAPSMLTFLYNGTKRMGNKTAAGLLKHYPEHRDRILEVFLPQNVDNRKSARPE